jgi:hypothetical protein
MNGRQRRGTLLPGILGFVGRAANGGRLRAGMRALLHFDTYAARELAVGEHVALGQVWRNGDRSGSDWHVDAASGAALLIAGFAFGAGSPGRRMHARELLGRYLRRGELDPLELDGSFVVVVADPRKGRVEICNDRLGTLPLYYSAIDETSVGFGPEAKALFAGPHLTPTLSTLGVVTFLNCGYCLGDTTLFENVRCLEPGSRLTIATDTASIEVRRYWKIVYAAAPELAKRRDAEAALYEATLRAHERIVSDSMRGYDLLLSGGWDSRGILAFLEAIRRPARKAVAWGSTRDIPLSDPWLAAQLASRFALPLKFIQYDSDQFVANAADWCRMSELANDNIGWFAEGASMLADGYRTDADFALVGDEAWGWHGHPRTERDVRDANLPATLGPELERCLARNAVEEYRARYEAEVDKVLAACDNDHPLDRRDFLYLHGRVARFIFALGYYKELAVEVRRPFLLANVLEVLARVPPRFRANKNLYISMLGRYFPAVAAFPTRSARSLPDWSRDIRVKPELRRVFLDLLDERRLDGVLGKLLDPAAFVALRDSFFAETPPPPRTETPSRTLASRLPLRLRQRLRATGLLPGSRNMALGYPQRGRVDLLRCLALVALLEQTLPSFAEPGAAPASLP